MGRDVSQEVAGMIGDAKVFGSSDNIRHGTYEFVIRRCHSMEIENDQAKQRMSFVEVTPLTSKPNPVFEGDHVDYPGTSGPLIDDGTKPNAVGSNCALKVNHDGPGGRSAGGNIKKVLLAVFNEEDGQRTPHEINQTWIDAARRKPCKAGDIIGFDPATQQPVRADKDKSDNPLCGVIVKCTTRPKKKKKANEKGAYVTDLIWSCASPLGTGVNTQELIAKRRAEILANSSFDDDDEEDTASQSKPQTPSPSAPQNGNGQAAAPPPPAPPSPPPPPVQAAPFTPPAPWDKHTGVPWGATPETQWFFSNPAKGGDNTVKNLAQLRAGQ